MSVNFYGMSVFSKFYKRALCAVVLAAPLLATPALAQQSNLGVGSPCVTNYDANTDYFPAKVSANDATLFSVQYFKSYKIVQNKATNETFALYQCGTPKPNVTAGTKVFSVPVSRVATVATTSNQFIEALGEGGTIVALETEQDVCSPCLIKAMNAGNITQVSSTNATLATQQLSTVDVIFGNFTADPTNNRSVSTSETEDPGALNRAEWIDFYSTFFNAEAKSNNVTNQINNNYNCLRKAATAVANNTSLPLVAWTSYYQNVWTISNATYKANLTQDAGGQILSTSNNTYTDVKAFLKALEPVDVLIDETFIGSDLNAFLQNYNLTNSSTTSSGSPYKFLANKKVFREDGVLSQAGGYDWFESAVVWEDAVLADVINAINSSYPTSSYQRIWIRNIALNESIKISGANNCTSSLSTPTTDPAYVCTGSFAVNNSNGTSGSGSSSGGTSIMAHVGFTAVLAGVVAMVI